MNMLHLGYLVPFTFIMGSISWRFVIATQYMPNFKHWGVEKLIQPLICVHLFRYITLSLLIPGLTTASEILPFSHVARLVGGDVLASLISMMALFALYKKWYKVGFVFASALSFFGLLSLLLATLYDVPLFIENVQNVDARLFAVLTTFIPLVFVSHVFILQLSWKFWRKKMKK